MSQPQETTALYKARQREEEDRKLDALLARINAEHGPRAEMTVRREPPPRRDPKPKPVSRCGHFGAMALRLEDARDRKDDDQ